MKWPLCWCKTQEDWRVKHYQNLFESASRERDFYKAKLYDSWRALQAQAKGMRRQRRLIKRLRAASPTTTEDEVQK